MRYTLQLYRHDVVAGSKTHTARYARAYITAVWAYYISGEREGRKVRAGKEGKGRGQKEGEDRICKEAKLK